jgi:hypothetical protein
MKHIFFLLSITIFSLSANCQLDKKTWLVGGTGSISSSNDSYTTSTYSQTSKTTEIKISPTVGYFLADKFAAGLKTSFSKYKSRVDGSGGLYTNVNRFEVGPFARYYFLPKEKQVNIVTEASYQFGRYSFKDINQKGNINTLSFLAGPTIYFNNSVGLEFLVGYKSRTEDIKDSYKQTQKGLQIAIGFQFHLIK